MVAIPQGYGGKGGFSYDLNIDHGSYNASDGLRALDTIADPHVYENTSGKLRLVLGSVEVYANKNIPLFDDVQASYALFFEIADNQALWGGNRDGLHYTCHTFRQMVAITDLTAGMAGAGIEIGNRIFFMGIVPKDYFYRLSYDSATVGATLFINSWQEVDLG
jgi:hypothetical protein